jgi:hypothetical protein
LSSVWQYSNMCVSGEREKVTFSHTLLLITTNTQIIPKTGSILKGPILVSNGIVYQIKWKFGSGGKLNLDLLWKFGSGGKCNLDFYTYHVISQSAFLNASSKRKVIVYQIIWKFGSRGFREGTEPVA